MATILQWEPSDERERARVGDQAEMYVREMLKYVGEVTFLRGPLVPHIDQYGRITGWRETDFLVYTQGTLFCVEVKNYSGTITYLPRYEAQQVWNGTSAVVQNVFVGYDPSKILQTKQGKKGAAIERTYPNPLKKTKSFIMLLKKYLSRVEPRFQQQFLIPVVCFGTNADIRAIYNFQEGMIQIDHLPNFFQQYRKSRPVFQSAPWIAETILYKIPNWDRVLTRESEWMNGILVEPYLTFTGIDGRPYALPAYSAISTISVQLLHDGTTREMRITYTNGAVQSFYCIGGQLSLIRGERPETFDLRNIQQIVVGCANKLRL